MKRAMSDIKLQGEFGVAYVKAVAHAAGYFVELAGRWADEDGVDLTILALNASGQRRSPRLDVQVKTTVDAPDGDPFPYDLDVKNYDELRDDVLHTVPRILVVVTVPREQAEWSTATEEQLILRRCGYWKSLRGEPPTSNTSTARIKLARSACFHPANLRAIMLGITEGRIP